MFAYSIPLLWTPGISLMCFHNIKRKARKHKKRYKQTVSFYCFNILQDKDILHVMLASVIQVTEIEFEEGSNGVAQIKDAAPFVHGE